MAGNPLEFGKDESNVLSTERDFYVNLFFDRHTKDKFVGECGQVVCSVGVGDDLKQLSFFRNLFKASMKISDVGVGLGDGRPIKFGQNTQNAVGTRVLGSHIDKK